jgi:anti-sigma-K factor RskA
LEARLRTAAADLIERKFQGLGPYGQATGSVIWSDSKQEGYMILNGIPANDPQLAQYQLWIVDPTRDEAPVDGGVFDIPTDGSPVVVPITAKLQVTQPQAFLITLEKPGGVVKSKREVEVALAAG